MNNSRLLLIMILLSILFYINIPPSNIDQLTENNLNQTPFNSTPYTQSINKTVIFVDTEGKQIGNITQTVNETVYPQQNVPDNSGNILRSISNLGAIIWPSSPMMGWVIIGIIVYFVLIPLLRWTKELMWG